MEIGIIFIICIIIWILFIKKSSNNTTDVIYEKYKTLELTEDTIFTEPGEKVKTFSSARLSEKSKDFLDNEPPQAKLVELPCTDLLCNEAEIINLFKNNDIIQILIPKYYIARISYRGNKIIKLKGGTHIIHKYIDDKMIYQINIIPDYYLINTVPNVAHSVQDWELNYFSHDYYNPYNILYPYTQIKKYNYYNFPRYNQYTSKYINHKLLNNLYFHKTKKNI